MKKQNSKPFISLLLLTILTKGLGFLKTTVTAAYFGASIQTDIYNLADGIINQVFYAFTISASVLIVPLYLDRKEEGVPQGKRFAKTVYNTMILLGIALLLLIAVTSPWIARILGREYSADQIQLLARYMQILAVGVMLTLLTNTLQSILNAERVYGFPSICAMMNSVIIILFSVLLANVIDIWALVLAVPVAYIFQTVFLRFKARRYLNISLKENGGWDPSIKLLLVNMLPVFLSNATMELNGLFDKYILAGLQEGAVTAVSYAMVLLVFATNIISIPVTTVLFTDISELCSKKQYDQVRQLTEKAVISLLLICMPIMIVTVFCAKDIVSFVYGYGKFSGDSITLTGSILSGYGLSIAFYVLKDTINRVSYALKETKLPMVVGILSAIVHIGVAVVLTPYLGVLGVVWATVISVGVTAVVTLAVLSRRHLHCRFQRYIPCLLKITAAAAATVLFFVLASDMLFIDLASEKVNALVHFAACTIAGFLLYFGILVLTKEKMTRELVSAVLKKFSRKA